jgi:hypothetical protein
LGTKVGDKDAIVARAAIGLAREARVAAEDPGNGRGRGCREQASHNITACNLSLAQKYFEAQL